MEVLWLLILGILCTAIMIFIDALAGWEGSLLEEWTNMFRRR